MIRINSFLSLRPSEIQERFIRASGPGGQNVNKLSSAVELRFDLRHSPSLPTDVRHRLARLAGHRLTKEGILVITSQRFRTQERNRQDALDKLVDLIRKATIPPAKRIKTKPTYGSKLKRLEGKTKRAKVKNLRNKKIERE